MLGIEIASAAFLPAALVALLAGILSFLSPCVLPIVPPYLAYMTGVKVSGLTARERSAVLPALFFVLGLSTVFLLMGYAASAFGRAFLQYQPLLVKVSGVFVILLGLHFLHVFRIPLLEREARLDTGDRFEEAVGGALVADTLVDRSVLVVIDGEDVDEDTVEAVSVLIDQAGGTVSGAIRLTEDGRLGLRLASISGGSVESVDLDAIKREQRETDEEEEKRILYVAMTRAVQELTFLTTRPTPTPALHPRI